MTRWALQAVGQGLRVQLGVADSAEAAEMFRARLEAALGAPVTVTPVRAHPDDCLTCRDAALTRGRY